MPAVLLKKRTKNDGGLEFNFPVYEHTVADIGKRDQLLAEENKYNLSDMVNSLIFLSLNRLLVF